MKIAISGTNKKVLFHIFLWSIWLYLPLSNVNDDEFYSRAVLISLLIIFTHIPLFVLNTEWLIPKILMPKGILLYILSLILTVALFIYSTTLFLTGTTIFWIKTTFFAVSNSQKVCWL